jgi:DNA-binding NtrC family response regulator
MHTVLVIEDQPDVASMLEMAIARCGHRSLLATNVAQAQKLWNENKAAITLVLADHTLPDGSGVDLANELRSTNPSLPIVITSGMAYAGAPHNFLRLDKPFTISEFKRLINTISPSAE